jgi:hypothetical protein
LSLAPEAGDEMVPSTSRRGLLAGLGGLLAGGTVAVGATAPTLLPDVVTDEATKHYPTPPEVRDLWRPTVTEAHAREAVGLLAETEEAGERLWARTDTDRPFTGAGGWLADAREALSAGNYAEALFDAGYGLQFAAEQLGAARARLGRADLRELGERGVALLDRADAVSTALDPYPASDPGRDLGWYYAVERQLVFARVALDRETLTALADDGDDASVDVSADDPQDVGPLTERLLSARLRVRTAERYRELHRDLLDGGTTPFRAHLDEVDESFRAGIASFPSRQAVRAEYVGEDVQTPHAFAHGMLVRSCFDYDYRFGLGDAAADLPVYRVVSRSTGLAQRRAHGFAVDHLVIDADDTGFDSGHVLAEKRRAREVYRSVVGREPPALLTRQVPRAVEDLQVAVVGFAGSYRRPLWRERVEAYCYALLGRAKLRAYPELYDEVVGAG